MVKLKISLIAAAIILLAVNVTLGELRSGPRDYDPDTVAKTAIVFGEYTVHEETDDVVNINTASARRLEKLRGIGAIKAQAIVDYREENGAFQSVDELLEVSGISETILSQIRDKITV